jgi:hypothetical protein
VTDITGDGTGDGSFGSNGGYGDVLPGTGIGSFGRSIKANNINTAIQNYNNSIAAGVPTPAGQTLINNGLFTLTQLVGLGGVQQDVPLAPTNEANMGWLHAMDLSLNWIYKFRERRVERSRGFDQWHPWRAARKQPPGLRVWRLRSRFATRARVHIEAFFLTRAGRVGSPRTGSRWVVHKRSPAAIRPL